MADRDTTQELFGMLNQPFDQLNQDIKLNIDKVISENPDILTSTEFAAAITTAPNRSQTASQVLGNLQQLKKENFLEGIEKPEQAVALSARESLTVSGGEKPRESLTIEQLRDREYQGTLTVDQVEQLRRENDNRRMVDLKNQPGDDKKHKREPSKDKFRDEDVIKYMYEEWFLGGASWLFNKAEDAILNLVDASCDSFMEGFYKGRAQKEKNQQDALKNAQDKVASFTKMTQTEMTGLGGECASKINSFRDILADLKANLGNPSPQWKYYAANDPFIKKLEALPDKGKKFIETCGNELENRLKMIETTGKIAMLATSMEMTDDFMRQDSAWKKDKNTYKDDKQLSGEFKLRSRERHTKILEAVSTLSEDARLVAEIKYEQLPKPKPNFEKYSQEQVSKEVNGFLKELGEEVSKTTSAQKKEINDNHFNITSSRIGSEPKPAVAASLGKIDKLIKQQIEKGAVYSEKLFEKEHIQDRVNLKTGLYEEAVKENSPNSIEATFGKMRKLNAYNQSTLDARRLDVQGRKAYLEQVRSRLSKRDGNKNFQTRVSQGRTS